MSAELLRALGQPADTLVTLDFETFHSVDYSLSKLTNEAYVRDPRFQALGIGVSVADAPAVWLEAWEFEQWARRVNWRRVACGAHHAQFDGFILSQRYDVVPGFWVDTLSMGRARHGMGGADLRTLGPLYGLGEKGEGVAKVKGKRREQLTQAEWLALGDYCRQDVDLTRGLVRAMVPRFPPLELWLVDSTVRMFTEPVFVGDQAVLAKARDDERARKLALLHKVARTAGVHTAPDPIEAARALLASNDKFAALLRQLGEEPPTKINAKGETAWAFAKSDPGFQALEESPREEIRLLAEVRQAVKSTITETRAERVLGAAQRGRVPFYLKTYGAHTGRWSGGDKMNPQNFNRGGALRDAILAPDGWALVVADSGQIEARVLPWLAGDLALLDTFRRNDAFAEQFNARVEVLIREDRARVLGQFVDTVAPLTEKEAKKRAKAEGLPEGDFYADRGSVFFLKRISKEETPIERQLAKNMILGLGFGMGWQKFAGELLKGMLGSDPVQFRAAEATRFGVDVAEFERRPFGQSGETCGDIVGGMDAWIARMPYAELLTHCAVAAHLVGVYRRSSPAIVNYWRACENVLKLMAEPGPADQVRWTFGCLKVVHEGLIKPSGLRLRYPGLRRGSSGYSYVGGDSGHERTKIYGGKLTENVVQSVARDIVAEQAMRVRADGYRLGTTTHDEVVAVVPEAEGPRCLARMLQHMRTPPAWCADLPLNAAGGFGRSYGAIK